MDRDSLRGYDESIHQALADDDFRGALESLVRGYQHVMVGFCTNMLGDADWGAEVAQEVFLAAYRALPGFRGQASVRTWLFAIARKQCLKVLRNRRRRSHLEHDQQDTIATLAHRDPPALPGEDPETRVLQVQQRLQQLDNMERAILMMRYDAELPIVDMAHVLGISVSSVRRRLAAALQRLREVMHDDA
jgi:RNA polymerase sigma-70 factor (ECF subfamily)